MIPFVPTAALKYSFQHEWRTNRNTSVGTVMVQGTHMLTVHALAALPNTGCCLIVCAVARSDGECPDAAGLLLASSKWSSSVLEEAHLLSGRGDAAKWARWV